MRKGKTASAASLGAFIGAGGLVALLACGSSTPATSPGAAGAIVIPPQPPPRASDAAASGASPSEGAERDAGVDPRQIGTANLAGSDGPVTPIVAHVAGDGDPTGGTFTLADATAGLPPTGALVATIKTSKGDLRCRLYDDKAPVTVANFVGLARGLRPFRASKTGPWEKRPAYDGTIFHRVIKGFMIQGGDPLGSGKGEPGYTIKDEIWPGAKHDRAGLLCMANRGPDTNGIQFFITDAAAPHLDGKYTIFGDCAPVAVVHAIAATPVGPSDRPLTDVTIRTVAIARALPRAPGPLAPPLGSRRPPTKPPVILHGP
jgi:peptidyl-prolyl cis-trans isomerase A (cyclophilin A)